MAWLAIRTLVEGWLAASGTPFYSTINEEQDPPDPIWMTVVYGFASSNILSYCREREEVANFTLVVYGQPGVGDNAVLTAAETVKNFLLLQADPANKFQITNHSQPLEFTAGDGVPYYGVEINFDYTYY